MNASAPTDTPTTTAPLALWRVAEAFMHVLHALFGAPDQVAARHTLRFEAHTLMASWLRAGEAMMRRLLLIEASAYAKPNARPLLHPARKRTRKLVCFTAEKPEDWRVSFRCFSRLSSPARGGGGREAIGGGANAPMSNTFALPRPLSHAPRDSAPASGGANRKRFSREDRWCCENRKPVRFRSAWPLAERYEALLRVFNDPLAFARRLARRLHATPHRASAMLHAPPEAQHRVDHFDAMTQAAEAAATGFNSS